MEITCKVLSCQQNWDLVNEVMNNSMVLEYNGWTFTAPITEDEMLRVLAGSVKATKAAAAVLAADTTEVQPPEMFRVDAAPDQRAAKLEQLKANARNPAPAPVPDGVDEDGIAQG